MLNLAGCRARQNRLLEVMRRRGWDSFLTADYRTVYYFTGALSPPETPTIFLLSRDSGSLLVTPGKSEAVAEYVLPLTTYTIERPLTHLWSDAARLLEGHLAARRGFLPRKAGAPLGTLPAILTHAVESLSPLMTWADATSDLLTLRRCKEPDEIDEIRASLRYCATAYRAARKTVAPGRTELDVYNEMSAAIVQEAGTPLALPGDFACGTRSIRGGGPPTRRQIQTGDLYILDLFPAPALYFGDTCRTFSAGPPADIQLRAWELVLQAVRLAESMVRPGVRTRDVYWAVKNFLDSHEIAECSFWHHLGHGIGHCGHEAPRIIPGSEEVFEVGDVIAIEPGIYTEALQGGIRLEDNYVVRDNGLENLFDFPMELGPL
jgi:Xaa-Pro dipeptidase